MKLGIRNVGVISCGEIELDGITVIAGVNNKGKSTVGKILYALLHDMDEWERIYKKIRYERILAFLEKESEKLEDFSMQISGAKRRRTGKAGQLARSYAENEDFFAAIEDMQVKEGVEELVEYLTGYALDYISLYVKKEKTMISSQNKEFIDSWIERAIQNSGDIDLDELHLQRRKLQDSFNIVFNKQYRKIGTDESQLTFTEDGRAIHITISEDWDMDLPLRTHSGIHFIESPRIYDMLSDTKFGYVQREYLQFLMRPNTVIERASFSIDQSIAQEKVDGIRKFSDIIRRLTETMGGKAEFYQKVGLEFRDVRSSGNIHAVNVSTGVKALALLEYALRIGTIRENDILILDEPEINLHPEWQMIYAGALVHLQKDCGIRILLTTHSPYFIRAIECYTDIEGQMERLNVYRAMDDGEGISFENLSFSEFGMTSLYDDLSAPLDTLEDMLEKGTMEDA